MSIFAGNIETGPSRLRLLVIWLAVTVILVLVNAFGVATTFGSTLALSFWSGLVGVNMASWLAWRRWMPGDTPSPGQLLTGAVLLNGLLAIEVVLFYRLLGQTDAAISWRPFTYG